MTVKNTHYDIIKKYQKTLLTEEIPHFSAAVQKSFFMYKNYPKYFINKSILDFGCSAGYTSWAFSLFTKSTHCYDPNPNCEFVFKLNNSDSENLKWVDPKIIGQTHYNTIFIYGVHNGHSEPHKLVESFVDNMSFDYLIIGDTDSNEFENQKKFDPIDKKRRIVLGHSSIYTYSLHSISLTHIDECMSKVSNIEIVERNDNQLFPSQGFPDLKSPSIVSNILYVCKKI